MKIRQALTSVLHYGAVLCIALCCRVQAAPEQLQLTLEPHICVVTEQQPQCQIRVRVLITGGTAQPLCLYRHHQHVSCKSHQSGNTTVFELQVDEQQNLPLWLKTADGATLATATLQLVQFQGPHKRHKRGYLWNML